MGPKYRGCDGYATLGAEHRGWGQESGLGIGDSARWDTGSGPSDGWEGGKMGWSLTRATRSTSLA